jgi:hypothetical protein
MAKTTTCLRVISRQIFPAGAVQSQSYRYGSLQRPRNDRENGIAQDIAAQHISDRPHRSAALVIQPCHRWLPVTTWRELLTTSTPSTRSTPSISFNSAASNRCWTPPLLSPVALRAETNASISSKKTTAGAVRRAYVSSRHTSSRG